MSEQLEVIKKKYYLELREALGYLKFDGVQTNVNELIEALLKEFAIVNTLQDEIADLEIIVKSLEREVSNLESDLERSEDSNAELDQQISELINKVANLEDTIEELRDSREV